MNIRRTVRLICNEKIKIAILHNLASKLDFPAEEGMEVHCDSDVDMPPADLGGEGSEMQNEDYGVPEPCLELGGDPSTRDETAEEIAERMQLRPRDTPPVKF